MPWISVFGILRRSKRVRSYFCPCREAPHPVGDFTRAVVCVMLVILVRASPVLAVYRCSSCPKSGYPAAPYTDRKGTGLAALYLIFVVRCTEQQYDQNRVIPGSRGASVGCDM